MTAITTPDRRIGLTTALACCLLATAAAADSDAVLRVRLDGIRPGEGSIRASLYRDATSFRKEAQAWRRVEIPADGQNELLFAALPPGRYALMVYHDANGDQQLNLRFGMFPSEGYGLSNNPSVIGPPRFEDSAFELIDGEKHIQVNLKY